VFFIACCLNGSIFGGRHWRSPMRDDDKRNCRMECDNKVIIMNVAAAGSNGVMIELNINKVMPAI
jgi:hypothetical protein